MVFPHRKSADLIITNGMILSIAPDTQPIEKGALAIAGGRIAAVGSKEEVEVFYHAPQIRIGH